MKSAYQLRSKRVRRIPKPEYAMTGIIVGIVLGWIIGFALELVFHRKAALMLLISLAGLLLGAGFEAIRFQWRMYRFRAETQSSRHPTL